VPETSARARAHTPPPAAANVRYLPIRPARAPSRRRRHRPVEGRAAGAPSRRTGWIVRLSVRRGPVTDRRPSDQPGPVTTSWRCGTPARTPCRPWRRPRRSPDVEGAAGASGAARRRHPAAGRAVRSTEPVAWRHRLPGVHAKRGRRPPAPARPAPAGRRRRAQERLLQLHLLNCRLPEP
jgi:hypothetical protein